MKNLILKTHKYTIKNKNKIQEFIILKDVKFTGSPKIIKLELIDRDINKIKEK